MVVCRVLAALVPLTDPATITESGRLGHRGAAYRGPQVPDGHQISPPVHADFLISESPMLLPRRLTSPQFQEENTLPSVPFYSNVFTFHIEMENPCQSAEERLVGSVQTSCTP